MEPVIPGDLKFCANVEYLESSNALGFTLRAKDYSLLTGDQVRNFVESLSDDSKDMVTLKRLHEFVKPGIQSNKTNTNTTTLVQYLFPNYHTLLCRHGLE